MTLVIDGKNAILGRLASYVAKQALRGEEVVILNCEKVIITGNRKNIREEFAQTRRRRGTSQKGPRISKTSDQIVKRTIRGMLPEHREGRGKQALRRVRCYVGVPKEFENTKKIVAGKEKGDKFIEVGELNK